MRLPLENWKVLHQTAKKEWKNPTEELLYVSVCTIIFVLTNYIRYFFPLFIFCSLYRMR